MRTKQNPTADSVEKERGVVYPCEPGVTGAGHINALSKIVAKAQESAIKRQEEERQREQRRRELQEQAKFGMD